MVLTITNITDVADLDPLERLLERVQTRNQKKFELFASRASIIDCKVIKRDDASLSTSFATFWCLKINSSISID